MTDHFNRRIEIHDCMVQVISHVFLYYGSSDQSCISILRFKWSVMYLYSPVQVFSHVFVCYSSSDQSCICILRFKWSVMYFYTTVQVISHEFVYYSSSVQSGIFILWFKWSVMYFYATVQVISHVFVYCSSSVIAGRDLSDTFKAQNTNTWPLTWTVVYKYMIAHLNSSIKIHDSSL
jgi:hypothetical protein